VWGLYELFPLAQEPARGVGGNSLGFL